MKVRDNKMFRETTYIGYSARMMELLMNNEYFILKRIITKPGVIFENLRTCLEERNISVIENDSAVLLDEYVDTELCIIYKYGHIIPMKTIKKREYYNIHPGSIRSNRGAHPLRWSVLLGDDITYLSLYKIDGLDEGDLICEVPVKISDLNYEEADEQMDKHLTKVLRIFKEYLTNDRKGERVVGGIYRNKIVENDYSISLRDDDYSTIQKKIRSVSDFGGAVVLWNDIKFRVVRVMRAEEYSNERIKKDYNDEFLYLLGYDGEQIILECSEYRWV